MRKLVLGIIALVCLDIGFVYYTSLGLQTDLAVNKQQVATATALPGVSNNSTAVAGPSVTKNISDTPAVTAVKVRSEGISNNRESVSRLSTQRRAAHSYLRTKERMSPGRNQPIFAPLVFYVPRHTIAGAERPVFKNTRYRKPTAEKRLPGYAPKHENRSLVARVWPVIKKPYEWMKVLGSKFN
ncbi:MAG TPA: hypothetical protein VL325_01855 [Pyrinomonadaceae bacterium]|nr:hypothetical protein [Pyrinomonadaceae bacterium]